MRMIRTVKLMSSVTSPHNSIGESCANQPIKADAFLSSPYGKGAMRFRRDAYQETSAENTLGQWLRRLFIVELHIRDAVCYQLSNP